MIKDIIRVLCLSCSLLHFSHAFSLPVQEISENRSIESLITQLPPSFTNLEHKALGDHVILQWAPFAPQTHLELANGLLLTYGDIVMFGGDLFGNTLYPIALCKDSQKKKCFIKQFDALAAPSSLPESNCRNPIRQVQNIQAFLKVLQQKLDEAEAQGVTPWAFYAKNNPYIAKNLNKATCGGSVLSDFIPFGQFIQLGIVNFDHFVPDAPIAYAAGHTVALETAIKAHDLLMQNEPDKALLALQTAYAQNAFACHFISDAMSSGHMRIPRRAIHFQIYLPAVLNLLIANLMHEEDSRIGLNVTNQNGDQWRAYGDSRITHPDAKTHKEILEQILQLSANHIHDTFISGQLPQTHDEMRLLPDYDNISTAQNHAPLFKVEKNRLLKRKKNHDPMDFHWTSIWNAFLTLLDFQMHKPT